MHSEEISLKLNLKFLSNKRKTSVNMTKFSKNLHIVNRYIIHLNSSFQQDQSQLFSSICLEVMKKRTEGGPNLSIENYDILTITILETIGIISRKKYSNFSNLYHTKIAAQGLSKTVFGIVLAVLEAEICRFFMLHLA